ncbi:hypothetical protein ACFYO2_08660 [Streptomyces sp. NPDC006602]|uniref:hypothetical protein n=1 Tax=Streptomyces sp. NPDC006602 TaxID=3364751 RepID=UPI0036759B0A
MTRPGVVVDTDSLVTHYAKVRTRRSAESDALLVLRVEVAGELRFGQVVMRPPRRLFGRWSRPEPSLRLSGR